MITVGIDAHKKLHVAVALDDAGRELGSWRGPNSPSGWADLLAWLGGYDLPHQVGIEGAHLQASWDPAGGSNQMQPLPPSLALLHSKHRLLASSATGSTAVATAD